MNGNYFRNMPFNSFTPFTRQVARPSLLNLFGGGATNNIAGATSKLSFSSILNGASKTLNFVNQAIPVYYQVKPMFNNVKTMFKVAQAVKDTNTQTVTISKTSKDKVTENTNNPTFFI